MIEAKDIDRLKSLQVEIELPQTDFQLTQIKEKSERVNWKGIIAALESLPSAQTRLPFAAGQIFPGYKDHANLPSAVPAKQPPTISAIPTMPQRPDASVHIRERNERNLARFLAYLGLMRPRILEDLKACSFGPPVRYQAWGQAIGSRWPLWTKYSPGCELAFQGQTDAPTDRIEIIDRVGIIMTPTHVEYNRLLLEDPECFRLVDHNLNPLGHRNLPFAMFSAPGGIKLTGAARVIAAPRDASPAIEARHHFKGQLFVEGWRLVLQ